MKESEYSKGPKATGDFERGMKALVACIEMKIFKHEKPSAELVTTGRFELEHNGHVATLLYTLTGHVLGLVETEVPEALQGTGTGSALVKSALDYAREQHLKVDVTCPFVAEYLQKHPEYSDLVLK